MNYRIPKVACLLLLAGGGLSTWALGQILPEAVQVQAGAASEAARSGDVPAAALLTDEGQQLAARLQKLRKSESSMGDKHPLLQATRNEIAAIEGRLAALAAVPPGAELPYALLPGEVDRMSDSQLRQLLTQMAAKLENLERRVAQLEAR